MDLNLNGVGGNGNRMEGMTLTISEHQRTLECLFLSRKHWRICWVWTETDPAREITQEV